MVLGQERGTAGYRLGSTYLQEDGQLVQGDVRGDGAGAAQAGGGEEMGEEVEEAGEEGWWLC